jgi:hypothetical protein
VTIVSPAASGNSLVAGETNPIVIGAVMEPFSLDQSVAPPLSFSRGEATNATSSFVLTEQFPNAFTDATGVHGQTLPTRIRITPFPSIPDGIHVTFDPIALSVETGATLTTLSGMPETVPRADGSTDVTFEFASAAGSPSTRESFHFDVSMTVESPASGTLQFQAALVPIGLAVPNAQFPSTDIPRYAERLVPDEADLMTGLTELAFPFQGESGLAFTGVAITNPQNFRVRATLTAYDADGMLITGGSITNPVNILLPRKGQYAKLAPEIFGAAFNATSEGTIRVAGKTTQLEGFYLTGDTAGTKLDGGTGDIAGSLVSYLPLALGVGDAPYSQLDIYNPGNSTATIDLRLMDSNGIPVAAAARSIPSGGRLLQDAGEAFGIELNSFPGGYIRGTSDSAVVFRENFGDASEANILASPQTVASQAGFYIPHFATGDQYSTELTIINVSSNYKASIALTLLDDSGEPLPVAGNPANVEISAGAQLTRTVAALFPDLGPGLVTGSVRVAVKPFARGPFLTVPGLTGTVRFHAADTSSSAALPLFVAPSRDSVYSHVAQNLGYFTGVAVMNQDADPAEFTLDVYSKDGMLVGSLSSVLQAGERFSRLLHELVPASEGQVGGHVRITSPTPLTSFALFGTDDLRALSAIPPQGLQ